MRGLTAVILTALTGCHMCGADGRDSPKAETEREPTEPSFSAATGYDPDWSATRSALPAAGADPLRGHWTLADATEPLPPGDTLVASIDTSMGQLRCTLMADKAPLTVALFIGLANGTRPWKTIRGFERRPAYDGSSFHRVAAELLIAGGRPKLAASDAPGIALPHESWDGMRHDRAALLCLGVGVELVITAGPAPRLDGPADGAGSRPPFTVFGTCEPVGLITQMASVKATRGRPEVRIAIDKVRVGR